jgi:tetratricopeptide (TPR) repeat protein
MSVPPSTAQLQQQVAAALQAGDLRTAESASRSLLRMEPYNSQAHLAMAGVHAQRDRQRLACDSALRAAERMGPQALPHIAAVTLRLIAVGEYGRALEVIRRIEPRRVPVAPLLVEFSQQLSLLEEHGPALEFMDAALALGLRAESVGFLRGNLLKFLGRLEEAARDYESSLAINPHYAYAHWALAYLGLPGDHLARATRVRMALAATSVGHPDRAYLHYALFKELDAAGDAEGAWQALALGAAARKAQVRYDGEAEARMFARLAEATPPGFLDAAPAREGEPVPVFVLGLPRTGTTLLERILGGSGQVTLCGELNDFRMQLKWCVDHHSLGFLDEATIERLPNVDFAELGRRYLSHVAWRAPGARHFSDKNPGNFMLAGLILKALPQARIVHLRREPMDACFSNLKELFAANAHPYSYDLDDLAAHHRNYSRLMAHWHALAPGRILDVRYEDLVTQPEAEARRVMAFCGLEYAPEQIRVEAHAAPVSTASSAQVRQPIHARNVGGWRRYAAPLEPLRRRLEADAG